MFTKGMKVRCTKDYDPGRQFTAGKEYVVRKEGGEYACYVEADDSGHANGWDRKNFKPVFKVSDRVRLTEDNTGFGEAGDTGTIEAFDVIGTACVCFDAGQWTGVSWWVDSSKLEPDEPENVASEPKFKVGDRVEIIDATEGYVGTQFTIDTDEEYFDGEKAWSGRDHNSPYRWKESQLRLVAEATSGNSPAIVARLNNGQPLPATRPHVHASVADASKEATRLAKANPGREFAVYEMVHSVRQEYEHEWQRIADTEFYGGNAHEVLAEAAGISRQVALEAVKAYRAR